LGDARGILTTSLAHTRHLVIETLRKSRSYHGHAPAARAPAEQLHGHRPLPRSPESALDRYAARRDAGSTIDALIR